jgi:hypothetical protein
MLEFNPEKRLSARNLLKSDVFDGIRVPDLEVANSLVFD